MESVQNMKIETFKAFVTPVSLPYSERNGELLVTVRQTNDTDLQGQGAVSVFTHTHYLSLSLDVVDNRTFQNLSGFAWLQVDTTIVYI